MIFRIYISKLHESRKPPITNRLWQPLLWEGREEIPPPSLYHSTEDTGPWPGEWTQPSHTLIWLGRIQVPSEPRLSASVSCLKWSVLGWIDIALRPWSDQPENSLCIWLNNTIKQVGAGKKDSRCFSVSDTQVWCQSRLISPRSGSRWE